MTLLGRASSGDRIILFTLVDLLVQIIFFAFFVFAAIRATQGTMQDAVARLAQKYGIVSVTRYLNATSKLVAISELHRIDVVPSTETSANVLDEAAKMLGNLNPVDVRRIAKLDPRDLRRLIDVYAALRPDQRGGIVATMDAKQLRTFVDVLAKLPPEDRRRFLDLAVAFERASHTQRVKIVDATASVIRPMCFDGRRALSITEESGGYVVHPAIAETVPDVSHILRTRATLGSAFALSGAQFQAFASAINAAHATCTIRIREESHTNSLAQFKTIQMYFLTF